VLGYLGAFMLVLLALSAGAGFKLPARGTDPDTAA
jgi:hypothetical protein